MLHETRTFTLGEREKGQSLYMSYENVLYCSYCGKKAIRKDIGSSHNHRWEEEIIYYCDCETAMKESKIKEEMAQCSNKLFYLERDLKEMDRLTENETVKTMKFNKELADLKMKYNMK